jgi:serine/threonine protein kinase
LRLDSRRVDGQLVGHGATDLNGHILGSSRIDNMAREGGMAQIYDGEDIRNGRPVAVKIMLPYWRARREFVERLRHEAEHAAKLENPNIVPIYDIGVKPGVGQYIVLGQWGLFG